MIAKLVVWGEDRLSALRRLRAALAEYNIAGLETNINFLMDLSSHEDFLAGHVHTGFIQEHQDKLFSIKKPSDQVLCQAALAIIRHEAKHAKSTALASKDPFSPFSSSHGDRLNYNYERTFNFLFNKNSYDITVQYADKNSFKMTVGENSYLVHGELQGTEAPEIVCEMNGALSKSRVAFQNDYVVLFTKDYAFKLEIPAPKYLTAAIKGVSSGDAIAPMPGVIENILVKEGDVVNAGDPLVIMLAMKMEYIIRAPQHSRVKRILFDVGDNVPKGKQLVTLKVLDKKQ